MMSVCVAMVEERWVFCGCWRRSGVVICGMEGGYGGDAGASERKGEIRERD